MAPARTLYYIPHTHWEGAVFFTREEYLDMGLPHIVTALRLLRQYPDYKCVFDQVAYIKPFLERYPEEADAFRRFVAEGRLEVVGGMDTMPDDVKPGGELLVRQMVYGKRWCKEALGVDVGAAWLLDTFGHHPQMPQLLKQAGFTSFWFCRGVPRKDMPSEFLWRGIDGTEFPAFWLPGFYGLFYGPPNDQAGFASFFEQRFAMLEPHAGGPERVGLAGVDVCDFEEHVPPLVAAYSRRADAPFAIRYGTPSEFAAIVARRTNRPAIDADLNPIFPGTYSSRIEIHQATREIEQALLTAEKLGAVCRWLGAPADDGEVWQAWEPLMFNQAHDLASGVMADHVYTDVSQGYDLSRRLADELVETRLQAVATHIDTRGPGIPAAVVVHNPLGWQRGGAVEVDLGFARQDAKGVEIVGPGGPVPAQMVSAERYADGTLKRARVCFRAEDVPALGWAVYRPQPAASGGAQEAHDAGPDADTMENEFLKVTLDRGTGAITSVFDKVLQAEMLSGPANVVARQEDHGDLWELYHTLDGASYIAGTNKQPVPTAQSALLSTGSGGQPGAIRQGPVYSELSVSHPFGSGTFATRIRLYRGERRVVVRTELVNNEKHVRYQVLFPTAIRNGRYVQEIPFGAVERPEGVEFPAQSWVDYTHGTRGVALLNRGLPGNLVSDGTLMLSLLRSQTLGDYNEGHTSDSGFELGTPHAFDYALLPHGGDWRDAGVHRAALELNCPLLARKAGLHGGSLPARWGLVDISHPNVVLSTCRPGPDGATVLRLYEACGQAARGVRVALSPGIAAAHEADLLEKPGAKLEVKGGAVHLDLRPFEILTLSMHLKPHPR